MPPAVAQVPALPVVHGQTLATDSVQETLSPTVLAVAVELERQSLEAAVVPGTVASPVVREDGRGRDGESEDGAEVELHCC